MENNDIDEIRNALKKAEEDKDQYAIAMHYYNLKNIVRTHSEKIRILHENGGKYKGWKKTSA